MKRWYGDILSMVYYKKCSAFSTDCKYLCKKSDPWDLRASEMAPAPQIILVDVEFPH
jgi:hypothetical protein